MPWIFVSDAIKQSNSSGRYYLFICAFDWCQNNKFPSSNLLGNKINDLIGSACHNVWWEIKAKSFSLPQVRKVITHLWQWHERGDNQLYICFTFPICCIGFDLWLSQMWINSMLSSATDGCRNFGRNICVVNAKVISIFYNCSLNRNFLVFLTFLGVNRF